ncbi:extracellular solute-binding protein [Luedemannella helvata]|uniref:Extracellular solute-binding protein n=1 Tax=Luedemannella helvata TaxID=349315 RepID=A0ABP4X1X9_9ACTN
MTTPNLSRRTFLGAAGATAGALALSACGSDDETPPADDNSPQTINWWHIQTTEPGLTQWATMAKAYEAANPNVKINITPLENEAFKAKLTTAGQAGNPPDLFQSWGGGVLSQQVDAGLVKDLSDSTKAWTGDLLPASLQPYTVEGKLYGIPWDVGMVGFWYNKDLFAKAGITAPPTTWAEFLTTVSTLKSKGVTPIALAGKDKWPGHFYWAYLAMRTAGLDALKAAAESKDFNTPDFIQAGAHLKALVDLQPFQKGFLAAQYDKPGGQAANMGNGNTAMELMGQWAPVTQTSSSASGKGLGDKVGFFTFPAVDGGKGSATDAFGGGNGFCIGKNAPPATVDFLKFLLNTENQRTAAGNGTLPTNKSASDAIKDPNITTVSTTLASATGFQLYLDQAFPPAVGAEVNDAVAALIAGQSTPEKVVQAITQVAKSQ